MTMCASNLPSTGKQKIKLNEKAHPDTKVLGCYE